MIKAVLDQPAEAWYMLHYWIDFGSGPKEAALLR